LLRVEAPPCVKDGKEEDMRTALALSVVLAVASPVLAQTGGTATDIPNTNVQALAKSMSAMPGGDELLRVAGINNGEYNVGVAVVHRAKAANIEASLEHHQITEIYHVISGSGTMVTGGTMENLRETADPHTVEVVGPSAGGGKIAGGHSRKIGAGDVVIIPPDTPHGWTDVSDELVYLVVRMDPKKVLKVK
jgi:mannose-6-phosphate isomerase-like protein (cupin superfamily)